MLPWIESYEPHVLWDEAFLQLRVRVYTETSHPWQIAPFMT